MKEYQVQKYSYVYWIQFCKDPKIWSFSNNILEKKTIQNRNLKISHWLEKRKLFLNIICSNEI